MVVRKTGGSTKRRYYAALHLDGFKRPPDAVRAAIVAENGARPKKRLFVMGFGFVPIPSLNAIA